MNVFSTFMCSTTHQRIRSVHLFWLVSSFLLLLSFSLLSTFSVSTFIFHSNSNRMNFWAVILFRIIMLEQLKHAFKFLKHLIKSKFALCASHRTQFSFTLIKTGKFNKIISGFGFIQMNVNWIKLHVWMQWIVFILIVLYFKYFVSFLHFISVNETTTHTFHYPNNSTRSHFK